MIIRCDIHDNFDFREIQRCLDIAGFLVKNGHRVAWATPKSGYERMRLLLPEDSTLYRLPLREQDELERLAHLHRKQQFKSILINRQQVASSYLFHLSRFFQQTILIDHGCSGMIYADMLINSDPAALNRRYLCHSATRLFLGPKFHLCDPKPIVAPILEPVSHLLLDLGDEVEPAMRVLKVLARMKDLPAVHVLCSAKAPIAVAMRDLEQEFPTFSAHPVLKENNSLFPYERYPFILTCAGPQNLELARAGRFFLTLAVEKSQVELTYSLSQKGVAPTLGWLAAREDQDIQDAVFKFLSEPDVRRKHSQTAMKYVDGQGLFRVGHLFIKD